MLTIRFAEWIGTIAVMGFYVGFVATGVDLLAPMAVALFKSTSVPLRPVMAVIVIGSFWLASLFRNRLMRFSRSIVERTDVSYPDMSPLPPNSGSELPWFPAMQYYAVILNRTFKVFVAPSMLCGAKVQGLVASPLSDVVASHRREYWVSTLSATLYERVDVTSAAFMHLNGANFQINWKDVARIEYNAKPKWGMGNVPHSGRIILRLRPRGSRELILLGDQDGVALKKMLEKHCLT